MLTGALKRATRQLIGQVAPYTWRHLRGPSLVVLTYHRVLPESHPDRAHEQAGMYVRPETLVMHLETLKEHFELVHLDDWLTAKDQGQPLPRFACAITFDDGWRDNYDHAFPLLRSAAAPATIFVVSALMGGRYSFWPNRLARQLSRRDRPLRLEDWPTALRGRLTAAEHAPNIQAGGPSLDVIDKAIVECKGFSDSEMHALLDELPPLPQGAEERDLLNAAEVRVMAESGLVRFGSHTRRHTRLRQGTPRDVLQDEIGGSVDEIQRLTGERPRLFCYPNGDFTAEALDLVRQNYRGAASNSQGWNDRRLDPYLIRRIRMHEDISDRRTTFLARLAMSR